MTEEKTCCNCGNKNCHIFYFSVKQDVAEHHETYEYTEFDCVNHDKWKEMKVEEIRTDNTETLKNAKKMTKEEIKNKISEHKECCKKLAEEYRRRYNEDNTDKLALNMFYHNVISYNDFETILATIEDRNSMIMCFSEPPILTEKTVEVNLNRIAKLEKENVYLKGQVEMGYEVYNNNLDYSHHIEEQLTKAKGIIKKFLDAKSIEETCVVESEAEQFLQEVSE